MFSILLQKVLNLCSHFLCYRQAPVCRTAQGSWNLLEMQDYQRLPSSIPACILISCAGDFCARWSLRSCPREPRTRCGGGRVWAFTRFHLAICFLWVREKGYTFFKGVIGIFEESKPVFVEWPQFSLVWYFLKIMLSPLSRITPDVVVNSHCIASGNVCCWLVQMFSDVGLF